MFFPVQSFGCLTGPKWLGDSIHLVVSPDQNGWVTTFVSSVLLTYGSVGEGGLVLGNAGVGLCAHSWLTGRSPTFGCIQISIGKVY